MRIFWLELVLVFAPFVLYRIYVAFVAKRKTETEGQYNEVPLAILFAIGLALAIVSFVIIGVTGDHVIEGKYTPATLEDGKIIPPRVDE